MLQKQPLKLNITGGIDQKHDEVLVLPSKLALLSNALIGEAGTVESRFGFTPAATTAAFRLATFRKTYLREHDDGLFTAAGQRVIPAAGTAYNDFARCDATVSPILGSAELTGPFNYDMARGTSTSCWVSNTINAAGVFGIVGIIFDETTGAETATFLHSDAAGTSQYNVPRILPSATAGEFHLYYVKTTGGTHTLNHRTVSATGSLGSETSVGAAMSVLDEYDVAPDIGTGKFTVALKRATGDIEIRAVSSTDGVTASASGTVTPSIGVESLAAVQTNDGTVRHSVFFSQSNNILYGCGMTAAGTMITQKTISTFAGSSRLGRISALDNAPDGLTAVAVDVSVGAAFSGASPNMNIVRVYCLSVARDLLSTATVKTQVYNGLLAGRLVRAQRTNGTNRVVLGFCRFIAGDATTFLVDVTAAYAGTPTTPAPLFLARLSYGEVAFPAYNSTWSAGLRLPAMASSSGVVNFPLLRFISAAQTERGVDATPAALCRVDCDLASYAPGGLELQNGLLLWGACPHWYDGRTVTEQGFNHRPVLSSSAHSGAAGATSSGTYQFYATYAWEDALGNWHESAPSDLLTVTSVIALETITFLASALNLTWKRNVKLIVYRTEANGSVFYRDQAVANAPGSSTISVSSGGSDAALLGGSLVPTSGDVLENEPLPAMRHAAVWDDRLWMTGCGDGFDTFFSQPLAEGFGPEFNSEFKRRTSSAFGRAVAVAEYGQRIVIFGEDDIGVVFGSGPSRTGDQDGYCQIQPFETALGAVWETPRATVSTPEGIWFATARGMRLLLPSGSIAKAETGEEVGSDIDQLLGTPVVAFHRAEKRELWVLDPSAAYYVWSYEWRQWAQLVPGYEDRGTLVDGIEIGGTVYTADSDGWISTYATAFTDGGTTILSSVDTPWLQLAGVQGFQRVYDLMLLGKALDASAAVTFSMTPAYDFGAFGSPEIASVGVSPTNGFIQWTHPFVRQKCESLKLRLQWFCTTSRFRLTNLSLMVGIKKGQYKLPSSQRI